MKLSTSRLGLVSYALLCTACDDGMLTVPFPVSLLILLVFTNRYFLGLFFKHVRPERFSDVCEDYEPTVAFVTPMFNEGPGIYKTIVSLMQQDYPANKLHVTVIDDCSKDDSYAWAQQAAAEYPRQVTVLSNAHNMGKRCSINRAVRQASAEIVISVDSDVVLDAQAVRQLVQRFTRPQIAAVGGRVWVSNAHENWLTRMQAIKYWFGYEFLKNIENAFSSVMCLSGCLTAYRRHVLLQLEPILEQRQLLGIPIKYGEDRFLTRQIIKAGYQTTLTSAARCWTVAPNTLTKYFAQQLRWRRSNIVDFLGGATHAWRLHPLVAVHYITLFAMLMAYPLAVLQSVIADEFWPIAAAHVLILCVMGTVYAWQTRDCPAADKVHPLWFVAMAWIMPVTYLLYTPLALFTLDSSSWETRGHTPLEGKRS